MSEQMSLREYLTAKALNGMLAHSTRYKPRNPTQHWHQAIAEEAVEIADAVLRALNKKE